MEKTPQGDILRENMELRQQVALLQKENNEMIDREANLKAINNQVLEALATFGSSNNGFSKEEIGILEEQYKREIESMSQQISQERAIHQKEKEKSSDKIIELENENWRMKAQMEALVEEQERVRMLLLEEAEKHKQKQRNAENTCRIKEEERLRLESKVKELELRTDREKRNDENQREALIKELESNLDGIKIIHEHEKQVLWTKMTGLQSERSIVQTACEQHQNLYSELRKQMKNDREEHDRKLSEMRAQIEWLENENGKIGILEKKIESHEEELKRKDIVFHEMKWKMQEKITELRLNLTRVEQKEKNCLVTLLEKDATLEEIKKDFARKLALERLRGDNLQDAAKKIKEDYTRKNAFIIQEILAKEEIVKKLSKELYKQEVALSRAATSANITRTHHNSCSLWTDQNNNSVQNQSQPLFDVRKIGNPSISLSNSNMSNLSFYNSVQSNLMNTELVPDLTLISNNVPSLSNNQTFINQFAKTFASPKTLSESKLPKNNSISKRDSQFLSVQNENEDVLLSKQPKSTPQIIRMQSSNLKQRRSDVRDKRISQQESIENRRNISNNVTELGPQTFLLSEKSNASNSCLRDRDINKSHANEQLSSRRQTVENTPNQSKVLILNSTRTDKHRKPESAGQVGQFFQQCPEVVASSEKTKNTENTNKETKTAVKHHDLKAAQSMHSGLRSPSLIQAFTPSSSPINSKKNNNNLRTHNNSTQPLSNASSYHTLSARTRIPSQYTGPSSIPGVSSQEPNRIDMKRQSIMVNHNTAQKKQSSVSCHMNNSIISFINTEQEDQANHSFEQSRFFQGSIQQTSRQAQFSSNYDNSQEKAIPSSSARVSQDCFSSLISPFNNDDQRRQTNGNGKQNSQFHSLSTNQLQEINPFEYESHRIIPIIQTNNNRTGIDTLYNNNSRQTQKSPLNLRDRDLNYQTHSSVHSISPIQGDFSNQLKTENTSHCQSVQFNSTTFTPQEHSQSAYGYESISKNPFNSQDIFPKALPTRVNTLSIHLERPLDVTKEITNGTSQQQQQTVSQTPLVRCIQLF